MSQAAKHAAPDLETIREAHRRIAPHIHRTPVMTSASLDEIAGAKLFFKCENLQRTGSFKIRGATNAIFSLSDAEAARGVVTYSSGNHAAALSSAARRRGIPAWVVMPNNAPKVKCQAVEAYGGKITFCEPTLQARESTPPKFRRATGAILIHPFDNDRIIAGQGTAALELLEEVPDLDFMIAPFPAEDCFPERRRRSRASSPNSRDRRRAQKCRRCLSLAPVRTASYPPTIRTRLPMDFAHRWRPARLPFIDRLVSAISLSHRGRNHRDDALVVGAHQASGRAFRRGRRRARAESTHRRRRPQSRNNSFRRQRPDIGALPFK